MKNKEIVVLSDFEHVLARSSVYIGSVNITEEKVPIINDGRIQIVPKELSIGFYKLFHEVLDNAIDEAKRMKGKMERVTVDIDSSSNRVSIADTGGGFYKGVSINKKSKMTNIETAVSQLRAGSNFDNETQEESVVGVNGLGISLVNMLSSEFSIETRNKDSYFYKKWLNFNSDERTIKKEKQKDTGTRIEFVPRKDVFKKAKWDRDVIHAQMIFKKFLLTMDNALKDLDFRVTFDGELLDLSNSFYPDNSFVCSTNIGTLVIYESYDSSGSLSFVNSAMCTGIHQRIINEQINSALDDNLGHHFYETYFVLNLQPKLVKFADQNKTKLASTRSEIEGTIMENFRSKLKQFYNTDLFAKLLKKVEDRKMSTEINKLRNVKRKINVKKSSKYFPPSGRIENLLIVEGESAMGSILQKRNTKTDGVYRLKGKIKNVRSVSDLSTNQEVVELMQILDLDLDPNKRSFTYKRVIIATDGDIDGGHITALLVNLFFRWFPYIIDEGRLFRLKIPLQSVGDGKNRKYFYDADEFNKYKGNKSKIRYLKGLGSLSESDWEVIMNNKKLLQIRRDNESEKYLGMAFGNDSGPRKKYLSGEMF